MSIEERVKNIEAILMYKHGTLDLDIIKERNEKFFKKANAKLDRINAKLNAMKEDEPRREKIKQELDESMRELEETKKRLGYDTLEPTKIDGEN